MRKLTAIIVGIVLFCLGTFMAYKMDSKSLKEQLRLKKPDINTKEIMEFWESDKYGFKFQESELSSYEYPRFVGKCNSKSCDDLIIVDGKDKSFSVRYIAPLNSKNSLESISLDNIKDMLKLMSPKIDQLGDMSIWENRIKEGINNREDNYDKQEVIDNNIVSFYTHEYSKSLVLYMEKVDFHNHIHGEGKYNYY